MFVRCLFKVMFGTCARYYAVLVRYSLFQRKSQGYTVHKVLYRWD